MGGLIKFVTGLNILQVRIKIDLTKNFFKWRFVNCKCYISIELLFLKELMLIKHVHQKSVIFVTIGKVLSFIQMSAIDVMIY